MEDTKTSPDTPRLDTIGGRIRAVRLAKGLDQGTAAKAIGLSRTSLSLWEKDKVAEPSLEGLMSFSKLGDVALEWLVGRKGDDPDLTPQAPRRTRQGREPEQDAPNEAAGGAVTVPEVVASLAAHSGQIDRTARGTWAIPPEVLELGFNCNAEAVVIQRVTSHVTANLARGDYVLIDTSRGQIDEPGVYIVAEDGQPACRALAEPSQDGSLRITIIGDARPGTSSITPQTKVLGRVMGIFHPI